MSSRPTSKIYVEVAFGDFYGDFVESVDHLGEYCHLNNVKPFNP